MSRPSDMNEHIRRPGESDPRERLLADLPVDERRIRLAGIETVVIEGGEGPPMILLHGPGEYAAKWMRVIPDLVTTHRVIAPDLPGHGNSVVDGETLPADRVLAWLGDLIDRTCESPPVLVGQILGGTIAAHFAIEQGERIGGLVLVDVLGLRPFRPAPDFGQALNAFTTEPTEATHDELWQQCAYDLDRLRTGMGEQWQYFKAYNLDRARAAVTQPVQRSLFEQFAIPAIPPTDLAKIAVPTSLIWGRHDLATPVEVAEEASTRYSWPLHVIDECADDPPIERPEAFLDALRVALGTATGEKIGA